jgi:hypothetical protein
VTEPSHQRPSSSRPVQYKGSDLDPEKGPGLGCFWFQVGILALFIVLTPLSVRLGWPSWASAVLLFATLGLLLVAGQTVIFLLRLVAADRREGRRRPMASRTPTVGELEDGAAGAAGAAAEPASAAAPGDAADPGTPVDPDDPAVAPDPPG